ncbi:protein PFC0760c-like [Macrobrachium nipponense]|uniref:protein PFC0760c-like n=1 Tax=Macrobrachium nipponense TaxID=159736 RepID=UPI0030C7CDA6
MSNFKEYFEQIFNPPNVDGLNIDDFHSDVTIPVLDDPITPAEVQTQVKRLKPNKVSGPDDADDDGYEDVNDAYGNDDNDYEDDDYKIDDDDYKIDNYEIDDDNDDYDDEDDDNDNTYKEKKAHLYYLSNTEKESKKERKMVESNENQSDDEKVKRKPLKKKQVPEDMKSSNCKTSSVEAVPRSNGARNKGPLELRGSTAMHINSILVLLFSESGCSRQENEIRDQLRM